MLKVCSCLLQDVLTDLKADAEQIPVEPPKEDWLGHKVRSRGQRGGGSGPQPEVLFPAGGNRHWAGSRTRYGAGWGKAVAGKGRDWLAVCLARVRGAQWEEGGQPCKGVPL